MEGIDFSVFERAAVEFDMTSVTQESIVNKGIQEYNFKMKRFV